MYVTTTDVSPADEQSKPDGCTVNMKHVRLSRVVTSETAPRTFACCNDLVAREAMTGEKTKQLKQEQPQHQSLINEISELNTKLKTDGNTLLIHFSPLQNCYFVNLFFKLFSNTVI